MFSFEGTKEANNVLEFVGKIPCDCKHRLKKPVSGSEIVGSAGIDEEARTCMKIKREETGERKGGGSLGPVSEVGEKGKKRGQIGKISASESPPQTTSRLVSLARFVFFRSRRFFFSFFAQCGAWTQARTAEPVIIAFNGLFRYTSSW